MHPCSECGSNTLQRSARKICRFRSGGKRFKAVTTAIQGGLGPGVVPKRLVEPLLASGSLIEIETGKRNMINKIMLATRTGRKLESRKRLLWISISASLRLIVTRFQNLYPVAFIATVCSK